MNQKLSESRAKEVYDYLVSKEINSNRMKYKGYGFTKPVSSNDTPDGRSLNRRTEFVIIKKQQNHFILLFCLLMIRHTFYRLQEYGDQSRF